MKKQLSLSRDIAIKGSTQSLIEIIETSRTKTNLQLSSPMFIKPLLKNKNKFSQSAASKKFH